MSLDDRLRDAFERSADSIEPAVEANLEQAIRRGTLARQVRLAPLVATAVAVLLVIIGVRYLFPGVLVGVPDVTPTPTGTQRVDLSRVAGAYLVTLAADDPQVSELGMAGDWLLTLRPTGGMDLTPPPSFAGSDAEGHTFTIDGPTFRTDLYYNDYCDDIGEYEWSPTPNGLSLALIQDGCEIRRVLMSTHPWISTE